MIDLDSSFFVLIMTRKNHNLEKEGDRWLVCESGSAWWQGLVGHSKEQRTLQDSQIPKDGRTCFGHRLVEDVGNIRCHEKFARFVSFIK